MACSKQLSAQVVGEINPPYVEYSKFLKNKECDYLDQTFSEWCGSNYTDIAKEWNERMRQQLKERYDVRRNLYDWDYQMNLKKESEHAAIINSMEYENWRETGIAYQFWDEVRELPNRTLASREIGRLNNRTVEKKGYFGDMRVSPYLSFGIETEQVSLYEKRNEEYIHLSRDVAKHNVLRMMEAVQSSKPKLKFIPILATDLQSFKQLCTRSALCEKFSRVFIGNMSAHLICKEMNGMLKDGALISAESAKFTVTLTNNQKLEFKKKIWELAKSTEHWYDSCQELNSETMKEYIPDVYTFKYRKHDQQ